MNNSTYSFHNGGTMSQTERNTKKKWCNNCNHLRLFLDGLCLGCLSNLRVKIAGEYVNQDFIQKWEAIHEEKA